MAHPKLVIYVGDCGPDEVDIDFSETWSSLLPAGQVSAFREYFFGLISDHPVSIRVYTDTMVNWVGQAIEEQLIDCNRVSVHTQYGKHCYNQEGILDITWPFGIFNY